MKIMLKTISILFGAFAVIFFFLAFLCNPNSMTPAVEYTLKGNRKIEAALHDGVGFVEDFRVKSDTLPTKNEFDEWKSKDRTIGAYSTRSIFFETEFDQINAVLGDQKIQKSDFNTSDVDLYIIGMWSGEWYEYYSSWTKTTSLALEASDYYLLGTALKDFLLYLFLAILSSLASILLWRRHRST